MFHFIKTIKERRNISRYELNYPALLATQTLPVRRAHLAQILDSGAGGMRLLVTDADSLSVGGELNLSLSPARVSEAGQERRPVNVRCKVVWQNLENNQIGLSYLYTS